MPMERKPDAAVGKTMQQARFEHTRLLILAESSIRRTYTGSGIDRHDGGRWR